MATYTKEFNRWSGTNGSSHTGNVNFSLKLIQTSATGVEPLMNVIPYYSTINDAYVKVNAKASTGTTSTINVYIGNTGSVTDGSANNAYNDRVYTSDTQKLSTSYKDYTFTGLASYFDTSPNSLGYTNDKLIVVKYYYSSSRTYYYRNTLIGITYTTPTITISASGSNGSVSGNKTIDILEHGQSYSTTLTATANSGYKFEKWSDGVTTNPRTFTYSDTDLTSHSTTKNINPVFSALATYTVSKSITGSGTVTGTGTFATGTSTTIKATASTGYKIKSLKIGSTTYSDAVGKTEYSKSITVSANTTVTVVFEIITCTVTYHKYDGTTTTATVNYGSKISNIPTDTRSGYAFSGWCKCEAVKVNGSMVESQEYNGSYCVPIGRTYMYSGTDKISIHIEAYRDDWSTITEHSGEQIISCTAGGGWGIGYFANTGGAGYEIHISGYCGGAFPFTSLSSGWHSFDMIYNGSSVTGYCDGTDNKDNIAKSGSITYNSNNGIFIGAEAGDSQTEPESPNARYWNGMISNVFISNTGELLTVNTNTEITGNVDLYPIWHYVPSVAPTFSSVSMIYNNQQISSSHKVLAGESFIVSCEVN